MTERRLTGYLASINGKAPYTRVAAVDELWTMLRTIAPDADHTLLRRAWRRLKKHAEQGTSRKQGRIVSSAKLFGAGLAFFEAAAEGVS